jgi:hypothetical protein
MFLILMGSRWLPDSSLGSGGARRNEFIEMLPLPIKTRVF